MANHKSSVKRAKQTITKTIRNKTRESEVKTAVKKIKAAITKNDKETASKLLSSVQGLIDKLSKTGIIKKQSAARKNSRLMSQVSSLIKS